MVVDFDRESTSLMDEPQWTSGDRNSITVATTDRLRVTIVALRSGARLSSPELIDTLTLQVLRGQILMGAGGMDVELRTGQLGTIEEPGAWTVTARDDAVVLLTAARPVTDDTVEEAGQER